MEGPMRAEELLGDLGYILDPSSSPILILALGSEREILGDLLAIYVYQLLSKVRGNNGTTAVELDSKQTLPRLQNKETSNLYRESPPVPGFEDHFPFPSLREEPVCQLFTREPPPVRKSSTLITRMGPAQGHGNLQYTVTTWKSLSQNLSLE